MLTYLRSLTTSGWYAPPLLKFGWIGAACGPLLVSFIAVGVFVAWTDPALAFECNTSQVQLNYCPRCTTSVAASTSRDTPCTGYGPRSEGQPSGDITGRILLGTKIDRQPKHGKATISGGPSWIYSPAKGFAGRDPFTIERDYLLNNKQLFVIYLQVEMEVR